MVKTSDYLKQLQLDKENLKLNLEAKGVIVLDTDTFTEMSHKVSEIEVVEESFEIYDASYLFVDGVRLNVLNKLMPLLKNITSTKYMFSGCSSLTNLDLKTLDTSKVENMNRMFEGCSSLTSLDLNNWNTENVKDLSRMFSSNSNLVELNIKNWNTENVTTMGYIFVSCQNLINLDLSGWNTNNVTQMAHMFNYCTKLEFLDIRNFNFDNVTSYSMMFNNVPTDCEIIVKDDTAKTWITEKFTNLTNVKTVAELEASA